MTEIILVIARVVGTVIVVFCLLVVVLKVAWNIGLAYAMVREDTRGVRKAWSAFPLIEVVPLLVAIGVSLLFSGHALLSARVLSVWGFSAILGSYFHMLVVAVLYGLYRRRKRAGS